MKKTYLYMIGCAAALMMVGCAKDATVDNGGAVKAHSVSVNAHVADDVSRLILDEEVDGVRWPIWEVGDQVALVDQLGSVRALTIDESITGPGQEGYTIFNGEAVVDFTKSAYPIVYPFDVVESVSGDVINIDLPGTQVGTTGVDWLMTGYTYSGEMSLGVDMTGVDLFNVVGFLELQVVGEGTVSKVTVQSESQMLSGDASLQMSYEGPATLTVTGNNLINLVPAEEVALNASTPTSFFVALPAGTYPAGDLKILFETSNGVKECVSSAEHVLEASHVKPLAVSATSSAEFIDLTAGDKYANSFIVSEEGWYSFAAKTRGGYTAVPHPSTGETMLTIGGETAVACTAWETAEGMVTNVFYDATNNVISFYYNGVEGNALITMVDNNLAQWHWHIWATDQPATQKIGNNLYMDRNLGAWGTPSDVADGHNYLSRDYNVEGEMFAATGLMWQWGRPVPFPGIGRSHLRYIADGLTGHSVYQRETQNALTCANLWVEVSGSLKTSSTEEEVIMGFTPTFYFPSPEVMGKLYVDRSAQAVAYENSKGEMVLVPWTNKWHGVNNTTNITMATAIQNPCRIYGTAAGSAATGVKYWCNDVFSGSFDFGSAASPWNYGSGAQTEMVYDVCPHGYKVPDGEQTLADFSTLTFTWRNRYNNAATSADGHTAGTTRTVAAYATTPDGDFVWVPTSGGRVFYGAVADWDRINWWCSSNNNQKAVVAWVQNGTANPTVMDGFADYEGGHQNWESAISTAFAVRCVKIQ